MAISNDDLFKLVNMLPEETKQSAYDFLKFLIIPHTRLHWDKIDSMQPVDMGVIGPKAQNIRKLFNANE